MHGKKPKIRGGNSRSNDGCECTFDMDCPGSAMCMNCQCTYIAKPARENSLYGTGDNGGYDNSENNVYGSFPTCCAGDGIYSNCCQLGIYKYRQETGNLMGGYDPYEEDESMSWGCCCPPGCFTRAWTCCRKWLPWNINKGWQ